MNTREGLDAGYLKLKRAVVKGRLTTGQAAQVSGLRQQTIIKATKSGKLKFYKVPGSSHRRISVDELANFMKDSGLSSALIDELREPPKLLIFSTRDSQDPMLLQLVGLLVWGKVTCLNSSFELGLHFLPKGSVGAVVVDTRDIGEETNRVLLALETNKIPEVRIAATSSAVEVADQLDELYGGWTKLH